jgi:hypothetical protein
MIKLKYTCICSLCNKESSEINVTYNDLRVRPNTLKLPDGWSKLDNGNIICEEHNIQVVDITYEEKELDGSYTISARKIAIPEEIEPKKPEPPERKIGGQS